MRKIAYLFNHSYFLGGGEISLFELIRCIDKTRYEPLIVVPEAGEINEKLQMMGCKVNVIPFPALKQIGLGKPIWRLIELYKLLKKNNVDLIHANGSRVGFYGGLVGRILGTPVVWHVREAMPDYYLYDGLLGTLAKSIICVSKSTGVKRFGRHNGQILPKLSVVYNGIDTKKFNIASKNRDQIREQFGIRAEEVVFGLVGNVIPRKAQHNFINGLSMVLENNPTAPIKAIIIGHYIDVDYKNRLKMLVSESDLKNIVIFKEYSPDIVNIFAVLDVFVLSSKSEGFSRALLEAMSCGLPVIASKIGEIEEAVENSKKNILVEIDDVDNMASAILKLSRNKYLRQKIGKNNRKVVEKQFSLSIHSRNVESVYNNLLDGNMKYGSN